MPSALLNTVLLTPFVVEMFRRARVTFKSVRLYFRKGLRFPGVLP